MTTRFIQLAYLNGCIFLPFGMEQAEAIGLIRDGIGSKNTQHWADMGCGRGTFTYALANLLAPGGTIIAIDKDRQRFPEHISNAAIEFKQFDFVNHQPDFTGVDGILMANSLHYVRNKSDLFIKLEGCFKDEQRFIIVEYENRRPSPWVPYPVPFEQLADMASQLGFRIQKLGEIPSRYGGLMYSALLLS